MASEQLVMALCRVVVSAAWADSDVSASEINCMKDVLFRIPALNAAEWLKLQIYIETHVGADEQARLLNDLKNAISTREDKAFTVSVLEDVCQADGLFTDEERVVLDEMKTAIESAQVGFFGGVSKLLRGALQRRSDAVAGAPNREKDMEDFIHNKIYYKLCRRFDVTAEKITIADEDLEKLCAAGGLMARIVHVDDHVADEEFEMICRALEEGWGVSPQEAALVCEVAISEVGKGMDLYRIARKFFEASDADERRQFLEVLFAVAHAHDGMSHDEMEEVRKISKLLRVSHRHFIEAKLKVSGEQGEPPSD